METETARGRVEPGTYAASGRYAVNLESGWPRRWQDWQGMSGAAVRSEAGGYLLGIAAWSDEALEGRRLTAVPIAMLVADHGFCEVIARHLGRLPEVEPVELFTLLARPRPAGSPGALLRADVALAGFIGRDDELSFLQQWRDEPALAEADVKALLVTGRGGEGKTRLAVELIARSRRDGWTGGLLRSGVSPDQAQIAAFAARPLLLVVDYAAGRATGIGSLIRAAVQARSAVPVRLLLLARSGGQWWSDLAADVEDDLPGLEEQVLALCPLLASDGRAPSREVVFSRAAASLAPHLAPFTGRTPAELAELAVSLPVPDLSSVVFEHALTVQMTALAALLQATDPLPSDGKSVEDTLLRHERKYRDLLAARRHLDDLREVRDRAVAGAALFGARGPAWADARLAACTMVAAALAPELDGKLARQREVAAWIAEVYPPDEPAPSQQSEYWGTVLPDRLGEFLVIRLLSGEVAAESADGAQEGLLESLADCAEFPGMTRALLTLSRAAEHDPRAADWAARLVLAQPGLAGSAALEVCVYAENPAPLRSALIQLSLKDNLLFGVLTGLANYATSQFSLRRLEENAGLTREISLLYRELAGLNRNAYLPDLARSLANHAVRLAEAGRRAEALAVSEEAVTLRRELAEMNPDDAYPDLASSQASHAVRLAEDGQWTTALAVSEEAMTAYRKLAGVNPDKYLPALAMALVNHAVRLKETGQWTTALAVSEEAVTAYRKLAGVDPDRYLSALARSLANHAVRLKETGRWTGARTVSEEAVTLRRKLAASNPDAYAPDLANSLNNHAALLAEGGQRIEALALSHEAVSACRELSELNRDAYLPLLAGSLINHAVWLAEIGRRTEALAVSQEAVTLRRELASLNRDAYLPDLAASLNTHAVRLAEAGRRTEALAVSQEAVSACRELTAINRDAHLPQLASSVTSLAVLLAEARRRTEALAVSEEAVSACRELAALNRDARLPYLALALVNHAQRLAETGRQAEALAVSEEAVTLRRKLAELSSDAHLPELAKSLSNHAPLLAETGRQAEALAVSEEAVTLRRKLAVLNRDAHLPDLAASLSNHAVRLAELAQYSGALAVSHEAVSAYRELVALNRDAYLPNLAASLSNHALRLAETGQHSEAVPMSEEAVTACAELVGLNRDAYLPNLVTCLSVLGLVLLKNAEVASSIAASLKAIQIGAQLPDYLQHRMGTAKNTLIQSYRTNAPETEAAFRQLTGRSYPDYLK